jgi:hypothetical protein
LRPDFDFLQQRHHPQVIPDEVIQGGKWRFRPPEGKPDFILTQVMGMEQCRQGTTGKA